MTFFIFSIFYFLLLSLITFFLSSLIPFFIFLCLARNHKTISTTSNIEACNIITNTIASKM